MTKGKNTKQSHSIPKNKAEITKLLLSVILSLLLTATAICFIVGCISLYKNGGDSPFSRESVANYLKRVAPVSFITIGVAIACGVFSLFTREEKPRLLPIGKKTLLRLLRDKISDKKVSDKYLAVKTAEAKHRRTVVSVCSFISLIFVIAALIFVLNPSRYSVDGVNTDIAYSVVIATISTLLVFSTCFVASNLLDVSYATELEAAKAEANWQKLSKPKESNSYLTALSKNEGHTVILVRMTVFAVATAFIIAGIFNGGMADVLGKAVRICTECIGLG